MLKLVNPTKMDQRASYNKQATSSLAVLWIGTLLLLAFMFYGWVHPQYEKRPLKGLFSSSKGVFVDQLLLSPEDLQLGDRVNLININLSKDMNLPFAEQDSFMKAPEAKKQVYSNILQNKLKKASSKQKNNKDDFIVKPLPR